MTVGGDSTVGGAGGLAGAGGQAAEDLVRGGPVPGLLGQCGLHDRPQRRGDRAEVGLGVQDAVHHGIGRPRAERRLAAGRVGHGRRPGEDVGGRARLAGDPLRGHVADRADRRAGAGQRHRVQYLGDAEVDDLGAVGGQDHVGRFEVPVHDTGRVDVGQRLGEPGGQRGQSLGGERPGRLDRSSQGRPGGILGDQERTACVGAGLDHPDDALATYPGQHGHLAAEPGPELGVVGQFGPDDFDRDQAAVLGHAEIDDAHAARPQPGGQPVAPDPPGIDLPQRRTREARSRIQAQVPLVESDLG